MRSDALWLLRYFAHAPIFVMIIAALNGCGRSSTAPSAPAAAHLEDKAIAENAESRGEEFLRHELAMNKSVQNALGPCREMSGSGFHRANGMPGGAGGPPCLVIERTLDCEKQSVEVWITATGTAPPGSKRIQFMPVDWETRGVQIERIEVSLFDPKYLLLN